jgi:tetratricopeptide (TPR) repeat protein
VTTRRKEVLIAATVAGVICLLVHLRALSCSFVHFDDLDYVVNNQTIRQIDLNLFITAFTTPHLIYVILIPLTEISYALDYLLWGLNPAGYHLTNVLLHTINTSLVVILADRLYRQYIVNTGDDSITSRTYPMMLLLAGVIFGIHPLRVESVTWISGRKDVLYLFCSLASLLAYLRYAAQKELRLWRSFQYRSYLISLLLFLLALLAKPVGAILPLMIMTIDWYPLGRLRKGQVVSVLLEKVPFLVIAAVISVVTIMSANNAHLLYSGDSMPLVIRASISGNALFEYLRLFLYPINIIPFYVLPRQIPYEYIAKSLAIVLLAGFCLYSYRKRKWLLAAFAWYLLPLLPVLALIQQGPDAALAVRYTYLPSVVLSIVAAAMLNGFCSKLTQMHDRFRCVFPIFILLVFLFYAGVTVKLIDVWRDTETFWGRIIDVDPIGRAYQERALFRSATQKYVGAADDFTKAIEIAEKLDMPPNYNLFASRAEALRKAGHYKEAERDFSTAISMLPHRTYYHLRGLTLKALGRSREAERDFVQAGENPPQLDWF